MNTAFVLMAQYNGKAIISIEQVCSDYFTHLTPVRKSYWAMRCRLFSAS